MLSSLDRLPDDPAALKAIILAQQEEVARLTASARAYEALVQALKIRIARLQRQKFGPSSEKIEREIEQLQLTLEDLEVAMAAACPECGGTLRLIGEDVSEILDFIAAKLKVVETARLKKSCRSCENIVQPPAPTRPIRRGMFGPGLLAHILVSKFDDHLPLYRQAEIFVRLGADIPRSTLIDSCGQGIATLRPLIDLIKSEVMCADRLHADDTPIKVLDPSRRTADPMVRGVKEGRIWVYVRDDRPWGGSDPPGAAYYFAPDRRGEHPQRHLATFSGVLQADAYGGFKKLYAAGTDGASRIREAACWAHLRRDFHDLCVPDLVRNTAPAHSRQRRSGQRDALCSQSLARLHALPRRRPRRHRQQCCRAGN